MRILNITEMYPPHIGGIEHYVRNTSIEFGARGHEVVVATQQTGILPCETIEPNGVRVVRLDGLMRLLGYKHRDPGRRYHPSFTDPGLTRSLKRLVDDWQPDVVIGHDWMLLSYLPLKKTVGAPVARVLHDYGMVCPKRTMFTLYGRECDRPRRCSACSRSQYPLAVAVGLNWGLRISRSLWPDQIDRFIAVSEKVASLSRPVLGVRSVEIIPVGVPADLAISVKDESRPSFLPEGDYILYVGALGMNKGIGVLLEAYGRLGTDIPLVLLGARKHDTPTTWPAGVTVVEDVRHNAVMAAWRDCVIGVVPSVWPEPFGQVAVEAASMGKPIVASAVGGLSDIVVHDVTGRLVRPGDPAALAADMRLLLDNADVRRRMGAAAAERSPRFTIPVVVDCLEKVLVEMTE